jgi:adenosylcobinamide-GDP ribazoletransferase
VQRLRDQLTFFMRHYLVALQFFTRVPVTGSLAQWTDFQPEMLRASAPHFPGVGLFVGFVACLAFAVFSIGLPEGPLSPLAAAVLSTIVTVLLTGAFHEDGLADTADGLGGSHERERALEIMKDSRVGSFGAAALMLALAAKCSLLAVLAVHSAPGVITALLAGHAVSRFWPLVLVHTMDYAGDPAASKSKPLAERIDRRGLLWAALWCLPALALMVVADGVPFLVLALALSAGALFAFRAMLRHRLQGFTGDCLGAAQQVCEIAFYLGAALGLGR